MESKPLAAYRLMHHSYAFPLWQRLFMNWPRWETTEAGMAVTIDELVDALLVLAGELPAPLYGEIRSVLGKLDQFAEEMVRSWEKFGAVDGAGFAVGRGLCRELQRIVELAATSSATLRVWGALGKAVAQAQVLLHEGAPHMTSFGIGDLLKATQTLPESFVTMIPELQLLVASAPADGMIELAPAAGLAEEQPVGRRTLVRADKIAPGYSALEAVFDLDAAIQNALGKIEEPVAVSPVEADDLDVPPPGYLNLIVSEERREIRRVGRGESVRLVNGRRHWMLFDCLYHARGGYRSKAALGQDAWEDGDGVGPEDRTIWSTVSRLNKLLRPLGVHIVNHGDLGYRLEEVQKPPQ